MKNEFYYLSADKETKIHAIEWIPEKQVVGVLQLCHGMAEYIDRYDAFAQFMSEQGYYVVGHDHLGHGKSVTGSDKLGFFHDKDGNDCVIADIHSLRVRTEKLYSEVPYYIMGHSMGSFLVRQYLGLYGFGLAGAIIMGTGQQPGIALAAGKLLCKLSALFFGWRSRSSLIDGIAVGSYAKPFASEGNSLAWLSVNKANVEAYQKDPLCGFMFTVNAYYHMFSGMAKMNRQELEGKIPSNLPILLVAGKEDPVGNFGKGVESVYERYQKVGMSNVSMKLYEGDRHEILNEDDRQQVYEDILGWISA